MKKLLCYLTVLFISLLAFNGCRKMDSKYKQYIVPGGETYTGKPNIPLAYAGRNRVQITWQRGADPHITKAKIFWNNYKDSVEVNIPLKADSIVVVIDKLQEKNYSFFIRNYDANGIPSVPVEVIAGSYGDRYQAQVLNRVVKTSMIDAPGQFSIQWGSADIANGAVATEVKYTNTAGISIIKRFKIVDKVIESKILDYLPGTTFQYRTLYIPKSLSVDTFYTSFAVKKYFNVLKQYWRVIAFSTQYDAAVNAAANMIDGKDVTRWYTTAASKYPHFVTIDMGSLRGITQFGVWRTTYDVVNPANNSLAPDRIQFLVSKDNVIWTDLGTFNFNRFIDGEQLFVIPSHPTARYFRMVAVSGPAAITNLGELSAYEL